MIQAAWNAEPLEDIPAYAKTLRPDEAAAKLARVCLDIRSAWKNMGTQAASRALIIADQICDLGRLIWITEGC